jgi:hypothetical protein
VRVLCLRWVPSAVLVSSRVRVLAFPLGFATRPVRVEVWFVGLFRGMGRFWVEVIRSGRWGNRWSCCIA